MTPKGYSCKDTEGKHLQDDKLRLSWIETDFPGRLLGQRLRCTALWFSLECWEEHQIDPDPVNVFRLDKKTNDESGRKVHSWHV